MNRFVAVAVAVLLAVFVLAGCSHNKAEEEALKTVIYNNLKALQEENVAACLATVHPESPNYAQMETLLPKVFQVYDIEYKLIDVKVLDISGDTAKVETVQEAIRLSGPENFRNNRSTMVHTLKKYKGAWKLYQQEQTSMKILE